MPFDTTGLRQSFQIDNGQTIFAQAVNAQLIVMISTANPGSAATGTVPNAAVATAGATQIIGVLAEPPDTNNMAAVQLSGVAQVVANGNITAGQRVTSDPNGYAVAISVSASGGAEVGVLGIARTNAIAGQFVDVQIEIQTAQSATI